MDLSFGVRSRCAAIANCFFASSRLAGPPQRLAPFQMQPAPVGRVFVAPLRISRARGRSGSCAISASPHISSGSAKCGPFSLRDLELRDGAVEIAFRQQHRAPFGVGEREWTARARPRVRTSVPRRPSSFAPPRSGRARAGRDSNPGRLPDFAPCAFDVAGFRQRQRDARKNRCAWQIGLRRCLWSPVLAATFDILARGCPIAQRRELLELREIQIRLIPARPGAGAREQPACRYSRPAHGATHAHRAPRRDRRTSYIPPTSASR